MRYSAANTVVAAIDNSSRANYSKITPESPESEAIENSRASGHFRINGSSDISPASARYICSEGVGLHHEKVL